MNTVKNCQSSHYIMGKITARAYLKSILMVLLNHFSVFVCDITIKSMPF